MRVHAVSSARFAYLFSAIGAVLFFASLTYFLVVYLTRFGATAEADGNFRAITSNVTLFSLFALHHSILARMPVRRWIVHRVIAGLERSVYVWCASLLFIAVCAWWRPVDGIVWRADGVALWVLRIIQAVGVWLAVRSAVVIDIRDLAGLRRPEGLRLPNEEVAGGLQASGETAGAESIQASGTETEFKTTGPYGWVRHPIYLGWFLFVWSASPMTMTRMVFALVSCVYLLIAIPLEERTMRGSSAARGGYERYMAKVPWRLMPGVY
jgi:hypothetical protein